MAHGMPSARGGGKQRMPKLGSRKEVRRGDQDLAPCGANRRQVRVLDVPAMPQVVADRELRRLRAYAVTRPMLRKQRDAEASQLRDLHDGPHALHRLHDRRQERAAQRDGEINARRLLPGRVHVVDDVDAAHECQFAVDVTELAMQPPQWLKAGDKVRVEIDRIGSIEAEMQPEGASHAASSWR